MALIDPDEVIRADNYINYSERDATPANDDGRVPKLEGDGLLDPFFTKRAIILNSGETLNGATLPVPVYQNKSDNELYACDGNDLTKLKFLGFVISNSTDGNPIKFQAHGIVGGFSSLAEGEKYYVQDTVGTIGTSPGTYEILVGIAISETQLLIQKGKRYASGTFNTTSTGNTTLTIGFRASKITTFISDANSANGLYWGGWTIFGGNRCLSVESDTPSVRTDLGNPDGIFTVSSVTDTTFVINRSSSGGANVRVYWEAEGEF